VAGSTDSLRTQVRYLTLVSLWVMIDSLPPLHKNAVRVQNALTAAGLDGTVRVLDDSARTVTEAAASLGVKEGQIAKSLVFLADDRPVMVVASGDERVDTDQLALLIGASAVTRPDADVVRAATGFPIGGVSPAALPSELPVYVEQSLARWDVVWAAAGTHHAVFPSTYDDLLVLTGGTPSSVGIPS
jgi:prolyl-tRNA editing enzyme YbaK/EbsC (Cys-tRNA(Pro) deacylase)